MRPHPAPPRLRVRTGGALFFYKVRYLLSLGRYILHRRRYPLFRMSTLRLLRKGGKLALPKFVQFGRHYYAPILRVPRWPSAAYDQMVAGGGLNLDAMGTSAKTHLDSAILGITRRCPYACRHCYESHNLGADEGVPMARWHEVVRDLQSWGASIIVLSGGEPMLRPEGLVELVASGDKKRSDFHVHTSGFGVTPEIAERLARAGLAAAGVALDVPNAAAQDLIRGHPGSFELSILAIRYFRDAGIFPYVNACLSHEVARPEELRRFLDFARDLGVGVVSMNEPKPCGRFFGQQAEELFSPADREAASRFFRDANISPETRHHPYVAYLPYFERPERFGCLMGGHSHLYVDSRGRVLPCLFVPVSFGSILEEPFAAIVHRMRKSVPAPIRRECPSLLLLKTLREKVARGLSLPIPYAEIEQEWGELVADPHLGTAGESL